MDVVALRRSEQLSPLADVTIASRLEDVLRGADHLVLAAPATARTNRLIDREALALIKPGLHLVNVARGSLVDLESLRVALDDGRVARATLDATDPEPLPDGHWVYRHPSVRLSPHMSALTALARRVAERLAIENLRRYARGEPLCGVVDPVERY
jgi:phosphoglycerate dehydrogenase-like enzyme